MSYTAITRATWTDDSGTPAAPAGDGTIINNARLQADVYDKIDGLHNAIRRETGPLVVEQQERCKLTRTTNMTAITAEATVAWDAEQVDIGALHDLITNNSRITVPTGGDGRWLFVAQIRFTTGSAATLRHAYIRKNGTTYIGEAVILQSTAALACTIQAVGYDPQAAAGDYYEVRVQSGTSVDLVGGTGQNTSFFFAEHLG